ncbi:hypothetical protein LXA43DRAFT_88907 [Ganoderma leucocontextum]|nr:hypothetical protein LXA43DRAFT_88907 [Ganoderma leucocontextum]
MPSKPAVVGVSGAYTSSELAGLTVPQLKALCKEKKISGYSKLGKQALIQKLSGLGPSTTGGPGPTSNVPVVSRASPPTVATPLLPSKWLIRSFSERTDIGLGGEQRDTALRYCCAASGRQYRHFQGHNQT